MDYRKPLGEKFDLAVIRVKATRPHKRIGVAFQAPGGPGLSGIDNVLVGLQILPPAAVRALERFDVVSFDERGSARSRPVFCDLGGPAAIPSPNDDPNATVSALDDFSRRVATTCLQQNGPFIYTMSTNTIARDMDMVRRALGERTMTIFGASAGTTLGAVYATMFPERVRARELARVAVETPVLDAYDVILCNDFDTRRPAREILPVDAVIDRQNPRFWGPVTFAGEIARCAAWPAADRPQMRDLSKRLDVPVLIIGNDFDPATPLAWTRRLARIIGAERHLVRYQGGGHGAYLTTGNTCVDTIVESYLFDLRLPKEGTVCPQQPLSFAR